MQVLIMFVVSFASVLISIQVQNTKSCVLTMAMNYDFMYKAFFNLVPVDGSYFPRGSFVL